MGAMFQKDQLDLLKQFVLACEANPAILHTPELSFFKDWITSLGGKIPAPAPKPEDEKPKATPKFEEPTIDDDSEEEEAKPAEEEKESEDEALVESDVELQELDGIIKEEWR